MYWAFCRNIFLCFPSLCRLTLALQTVYPDPVCHETHLSPCRVPPLNRLALRLCSPIISFVYSLCGGHACGILTSTLSSLVPILTASTWRADPDYLLHIHYKVRSRTPFSSPTQMQTLARGLGHLGCCLFIPHPALLRHV